MQGKYKAYAAVQDKLVMLSAKTLVIRISYSKEFQYNK